MGSLVTNVASSTGPGEEGNKENQKKKKKKKKKKTMFLCPGSARCRGVKTQAAFQLLVS